MSLAPVEDVLAIGEKAVEYFKSHGSFYLSEFIKYYKAAYGKELSIEDAKDACYRMTMKHKLVGSCQESYTNVFTGKSPDFIVGGSDFFEMYDNFSRASKVAIIFKISCFLSYGKFASIGLGKIAELFQYVQEVQRVLFSDEPFDVRLFISIGKLLDDLVVSDAKDHYELRRFIDGCEHLDKDINKNNLNLLSDLCDDYSDCVIPILDAMIDLLQRHGYTFSR